LYEGLTKANVSQLQIILHRKRRMQLQSLVPPPPPPTPHLHQRLLVGSSRHSCRQGFPAHPYEAAVPGTTSPSSHTTLAPASACGLQPTLLRAGLSSAPTRHRTTSHLPLLPHQTCTSVCLWAPADTLARRAFQRTHPPHK